ncbi:MAG: D-Ala-D-Ala carboxypeptidase family metallohydrolase [Eubacteriaceae bacterium]|nr:D-Ala-D-Ala carboxypeptidase family metallohydrolase [Eubacteriaceae bacterium]
MATYSLKADGNKKLSTHFTVKDFACPGTDKVMVTTELVNMVEKVVFSYLGADKITINDGYRSPEYNKKIGGSTTSQHLTGNALDFSCQKNGKKFPASMVCEAAQVNGVKGIEWISSTALHLDTRTSKWFSLQGAPDKNGNRTYKTINDFFDFFSHVKAAGSSLPTLMQKDSGLYVLRLQLALGSLDADGEFGPKTKTAVMDYQKSKGLVVDGIVGKNTWASLKVTN